MAAAAALAGIATGEQILRRGGEAARRRPRRHRHHIGHEVPGRSRGRHPMAECECRSSTLPTIASSAHPKQPPRSYGHRVPPPAAPDESQVWAARVSPVGGSERPLQVPRALYHSHSELGSRVQVPARQAGCAHATNQGGAQDWSCLGCLPHGGLGEGPRAHGLPLRGCTFHSRTNGSH